MSEYRDYKEYANPATQAVKHQIESYCRDHNISVMKDGRLVQGKYKDTIEIETVLLGLRLALNGWMNASGFARSGLTAELVKDTVNEMVKSAYVGTLNEIRSALSYQPSARQTELLTRFMRTALCKEPSSVDIAVLGHFLWQVRRKLFKPGPVKYHIMPVLVGPQKIGKSVAIASLLAPLRDLAQSGMSVTNITDARSYATFQNTYVTLLDEMAGAARADIEKLKEVITSETLTYRPLGTNSKARIDQNTTFIGTSNNPLINIVKDSTGMRRFYEWNAATDTTDAQRRTDFWASALRPDEIIELWRSVNENDDPVFYLANEQAINEHQEDLRSKSSFEEFIIERGYSRGAVRVELRSLYDDYVKYCRDEAGIDHPMQRTNFGRALVNAGFSRTISNGKTYYEVNKPVAGGMFPDLNKRLEEVL